MCSVLCLCASSDTGGGVAVIGSDDPVESWVDTIVYADFSGQSSCSSLNVSSMGYVSYATAVLENEPSAYYRLGDVVPGGTATDYRCDFAVLGNAHLCGVSLSAALA